MHSGGETQPRTLLSGNTIVRREVSDHATQVLWENPGCAVDHSLGCGPDFHGQRAGAKLNWRSANPAWPRLVQRLVKRAPGQPLSHQSFQYAEAVRHGLLAQSIQSR